MNVSWIKGFPRIRGGDPSRKYSAVRYYRVFPASAGVIPMLRRISGHIKRFPRIRGGDPIGADNHCAVIWFSPHPRG